MLDDLRADEERLFFVEEELRELTMKEADILLQLTEVRAAQQRARRLVAETKNRHTPILTLPDELLVSIVQEAQQPTGGEGWGDFTKGGMRFEIVASHISQRFRWAVIGASSLWSSIELYWGVESDEDRFAAYLARSRTCPLSVTMNYDAFYGKAVYEYEDVPSQLAAVAQHISRIGQLTIHCDGTGLNRLDAIMHFHSLHAPCLEYLDISSHSPEPQRSLAPTIFRGGAPRLTSLRLNNISFAMPFHVPWVSGNPWVSGLTSLDFRAIPGTPCQSTAQLLADCPQLIDLTLNGSTFFIVAAFIPMPVPLLFLRCLRVLCLPDQSKFWGSLTAGVLWNIHTPALEELHLSGWHSNRAHITDFFNRLPPSKVLKSLTFANSSGVNVCGGCDDYPEHIRPQALQSFPALESLTLINICDVDTLLGELLVTSTDSAGVQCCALSSLHTLTLRYKDSDEFGIDAWPKLQSVPPDPADMVTSRLDDLRTSVARLREIRPIHLRLPCSRFFTGQDDWNPDDPNFEIFDVELLLQYCEDTEDTIHWD